MTYIARLVNPLSLRALRSIEFSISPGHPSIPIRYGRMSGASRSEDDYAGVGIDPNPMHAGRSVDDPQIQVVRTQPAVETLGVSAELDPRNPPGIDEVSCARSPRIIPRRHVPFDEERQARTKRHLQPKEPPAEFDSIRSHPRHPHRRQVEASTEADDVGRAEADSGRTVTDGVHPDPPTERALRRLGRVHHRHQLDVVVTEWNKSIRSAVAGVTTTGHRVEPVLIQQPLRGAIEVGDRQDRMIESQHGPDATPPGSGPARIEAHRGDRRRRVDISRGGEQKCGRSP